MHRFFLILILLFNIGQLTAGDGLQKGIDAYNQKKYTEAISIFEEEIKNDGANSALYFNLGTAYMQQKNIAKARLNLERALLLDPSNKSIKNNLSILVDRVSTTIIPLQDFFLKRWWKAIYNVISPTIWALITLAFCVTIFSLLYFLWFKNIPNPSLIKSLLYTATALAIISTLAGINHYQATNYPNTAVVMKTTSLYASASQTSDSVKDVSPGVKLIIQETISDWIKVRTLDLEEGWVKSSDIEKI